MATDKFKFQLRTDYVKTFEKLTDEEAGKLVKHLFKYVNGLDEDPDPIHSDKLIELLFEPIKQDLKIDLKRWREKCNKNRQTSRDYWDSVAKERSESNGIQTVSNGNRTVSDKDSDEDSDEDKDNIKYIVEYLNSKTDKNFQYKTPATKKIIIARLRDGFSVEDFKTVIETKAAQWICDKKMSSFLRPQTLFGTKFESYLNEKPQVYHKNRASL